jgi:septal ring factor EnvC (AmiA/AmiB activator)
LSRARLAAALALAFAFAADPQAAPPEKADPAQLEALRARIERLRVELAESEEDRGEAREELRESERSISRVNRSLRDLAGRRATARSSLNALARKREHLQAQVAARERDLGRMLASSYVTGERGQLKLLLSGQDPNQTARDLQYLAYLARAHAGLVNSLRGDLADLRELEAQAKETSAELAAIERAQRADRGELLRQRAERRRLLDRLSGKIRAQRREVAVLERDEARLARLVEELSRLVAVPPAGASEAGREADAVQLKGQLRLPLRGVLTHRFGAPRAGGGPPWKGLFIQAPQGTEVRAAAPGQVVFADWMRGYGNLLIIDHGIGYMTIYANNESLLKGVGERVSVTDVIATVGASGGGQETGLYFEARHEGKAFDPMASLTLR